MGTGLITLPLRLGLRIAGFVLREVGLLGERDDQQQQQQARPVPRKGAPVRPRRPVVWDEPRPKSRTEDRAEPERVSEEPALVAVAEANPTDGPGAEVSVGEPWDGYSRMKATEIIARLGDASAEELAIVQLYEGSNRRRKTVLDAAARSRK